MFWPLVWGAKVTAECLAGFKVVETKASDGKLECMGLHGRERRRGWNIKMHGFINVWLTWVKMVLHGNGQRTL